MAVYPWIRLSSWTSWLQQLLTTLTSLFPIPLVPPCFWGWLWVFLCFVLLFVKLFKIFHLFYVFETGRGISCVCSVCHSDRKCSPLLFPPYPVIEVTVRMWSRFEMFVAKWTVPVTFPHLFFLSRFWSVADESHHDSGFWDSNGPTPASAAESFQRVYWWSQS